MLKLIAPIVLLFVALFAMLGTVGATSASLSVSPAGQTVDDGTSFTIRITQNSGVPTAGAETDISFDFSLLQISTVQAGAGYTGGALLMGVAPQTPAQAIAEANTTGTLKNVSVFFLPGLGSAPAGEAEFVALNMQAKPGIGGASPVTLSGSEMLDEQGSPITVSVTNGQVTVNGPTPTPGPATPTPTPTPTPTVTPEPTADTSTPTGTGSTPTPTGATATPSPGSETPTPDGPTPTPTATPDVSPTTTTTPTPTAAPSPTPTPSPTIAAGTRTPVPGGGTLLVSPSTQTVPPGSTVSVAIKQNSSMVTTGVQASFSFDPLLLQIVSVERGKPYQRASLIYGLVPEGQPPRTGPIAIADANASGTLWNITTFFLPGSGSIQPGEADFVKITLQAKDNNGSSHLTLSGSPAAQMSVLDESGREFGVVATNGEVVVQTGAPAPLGASRNPSSLPNSGGLAGEDGSGVPIWLIFTAGLLFGGGVAMVSSRRLVRN